LIGLARAYFELERYEPALVTLQKVLMATPDRADAHCLLGSIYTEQGKADIAEGHYQKVLASDPENHTAIIGIGNIKMERGDFEGAKENFLSVLALDVNNIEARFYLTQVEKVSADDPNTEVLESLLTTQTTMSNDQKISLHYALGKAYDDSKRYDKAFPHFAAGAKLKRSKIHFVSEDDTRLTESIIELSSEQALKNWQGAGTKTNVPIFILGMPRSGTTLVEQIISSHPDVYGAGELDYLIQLSQKIISSQTDVSSEVQFPQNLSHLTPELLTQFGQEYLESIQALAPEAKRITDKMPANYLLMGLIPLILPGAKIIHVKRNPIDTCVSCFTRLFNRHQNATYDLEELGVHYMNYLKLMEHWRKVMPADQFLEVEYENLISNTEREVRRLLKYCDLKWDKKCLAFHKNERNIRTASVTQVRQPVYKTSMERWRHYEKHLGPLLNILRK
jgi:tetratricopeptide (TPR) repeat protein